MMIDRFMNLMSRKKWLYGGLARSEMQWARLGTTGSPGAEGFIVDAQVFYGQRGPR
jgi:hypothetical protein